MRTCEVTDSIGTSFPRIKCDLLDTILESEVFSFNAEELIAPLVPKVFEELDVRVKVIFEIEALLDVRWPCVTGAPERVGFSQCVRDAIIIGDRMTRIGLNNPKTDVVPQLRKLAEKKMSTHLVSSNRPCQQPAIPSTWSIVF
jgi:hypothetical protein